MAQQRPEMRTQSDEAQGLAELSVRTKIPVSKLPLRRATDVGREDELRAIAKEKLLAMAGFTTEQAKTELRPVQEAEAPTQELSPEQVWFGEFKRRFDALPQLHEGVQWIDVEKSLRADPEATRKLQALDEKGHNMNIFGEENGEFVFASGWGDVNKVSADHKHIVFDEAAQRHPEEHCLGESCNGNATDIAKALGVDLADTKFHEQLRRAIAVNGWAWLKTESAIRKTGLAFYGSSFGISGRAAYDHNDFGSLRAALRVKRV
ncbi:DUF4256 domain-containing protein [Candidatus Peregrinibacteria bacterium]|nr:DUF4256 domain-containing protein [Candidatus Peregrinibacteria bacterium]